MSLFPTRRAALIGGAATLAGCAGMRATGTGPTPSFLPSPRQSPTPPPPPPIPPLYTPPVGEALPNLKRAAGRLAQALATYAPTDPMESGLPAGYVGSPGDLRLVTAPLRVADRFSRADVETVQYGGLAPVSGSATFGVCMVVLRQTLFDSESRRKATVLRTFDLRLRLRTGNWLVEDVASVGGSAIAKPAGLSATAQRVIDDDRIVLTDTARWDIYTGKISPALLDVLVRLSDIATLQVTVLKTGHPRLVVDGRRPAPVSSHFRGRAVDIFGIDGAPVSRAPSAAVRGVVEAARGLTAVRQLGVPDGYDLDAGKRRIFSNLVHADHLHVAVGGAGTSSDAG